MKTEVYGAVSAVVAILFSIILWFQWLGTSTYTMVNGIQTAIVWLIGVVILSIASGLLGYLSDWFKSALGMEDTVDIFDMLGIVVTFLFTLIHWFTWLSDPLNFTVTGVINASILWIVIAVIISIGALLIDFLRTKFFSYLPKPDAAAKALKTK